MTGPNASVIIFCRSHPETLGRVLDGFYAQAGTQPFEIVLVDSSEGSAASSVAGEHAIAQRVKIVRSSEGLTPGAARNAGIEAAQGKYLLFCEDDVIPASDWVARRVRWHETGEAAVAQAWECAPPRTLTARTQLFTRFSSGLPSGKARRTDRPLFGWSYDKEKLAVNFDEELSMAEDSELNERLIESGAHVFFDPDLRAQHIGVPSFGALQRHHRAHGRSVAELAAHPSGERVRSKYDKRGLTLMYPPARWLKTLRNASRAGIKTTLWFLFLTPWELRAYRAWAKGYVEGSRGSKVV